MHTDKQLSLGAFNSTLKAIGYDGCKIYFCSFLSFELISRKKNEKISFPWIPLARATPSIITLWKYLKSDYLAQLQANRYDQPDIKERCIM